MLSHPIEGGVQDIGHITEQEVIEIERKHAMVPWRWVNVRPKRKTVILCIDPDSDSNVVIEEGEGDFKERCIIVKGEERNVEEEAEQADNKQSEQPTEAGTKPETSLATEQETEDKDETISSTSTQDFDREKVERERVHKSHLTLSTDQWELQKIGGRSTAYEKTSAGYTSHRYAHTTYD